MIDVLTTYLTSWGVSVQPNRSYTQFVLTYGDKWGVYDWEQLQFLASEFKAATFPDWFVAEEE